MTHDIDYDYQVAQMNKFLDILKLDVQHADMAHAYGAMLTEEYEIALGHAKEASASTDEGEIAYIADAVVDRFAEFLDEVRQFVAGAVLWS